MERVPNEDYRAIDVQEEIGQTGGSGVLVATPTVGAGYPAGCFTYFVDSM